jgi:hypothetical protein
MHDVTMMILKGLELTRFCFIEQCCRVDRNASVSTLRLAQLPIPFERTRTYKGLFYRTVPPCRQNVWFTRGGELGSVDGIGSVRIVAPNV